MYESEDSDDDSLVPDKECDSDDELHTIKQHAKKLKDSMYNPMNIPKKSHSEDSGFDSQIIRSLSSLSEDENAKRKRKMMKKTGSTDGVQIGKFVRNLQTWLSLRKI